MLYLICLVCIFISVCVGWHFGEKSGFKYGYASGKDFEKNSLISVTLPAKCPYCNKEYGITYSPNHKGLM
jgi:hypothetical protein